ncbi:TonB-dependent receptor domain-containing protein [Porphyromonas sp. COT-239 OH1446]|uniref:TonB-dependent receptor domain-containing protein n=1 Tax=Porphyromonas sp. COT-239 OH1446 TaxID=1515613 RepID=UPI00126A1831|nr:TonB-dependent receptor [Porphyromonas sp. COT-239 OH1446]
MMNKLSLLLLVGGLSATTAVAAPALEQIDSLRSKDLGELVVYGTRSVQPLKKVPGKIELIQAPQIERSSYSNLSDLLKNKGSVDVIQYPGFLANVGIRGFRPGDKYTTVLINGIPLGSGNISTIGLTNIEQIEVLKGPFSSVYGTNAMGGVVNVITKRNKGQLKGTLSSSAGSYGLGSGSLSLGGHIVDNLSFDLSASYNARAHNYKLGSKNFLSLTQAEQDLLDPNTKGIRMPSSTYGVASGNLRVGYDFSEDWSLNFYENFFLGSSIYNGGSIWGVYGSSKKDLNRSTTSFELAGRVAGIHRLTFTPYLSLEKADNYNDATDKAYISSVSDTRTYGAILQDQMRLGSHILTLGLDYKTSDYRTERYKADGSANTLYKPNYKTNSLGFFAQGSLYLLDDALSVAAGVRGDLMRFDLEAYAPLKSAAKRETHTVLSPNLGLKYEIIKGLRLHASAGSAFAAPDAYQKAGSYVMGNRLTQGNPDLKPERSLTIDAGVGYSNHEAGIEVDVTLFDTRHKDMIISHNTGQQVDGLNLSTFINADEAHMRGLEAILSYDFGSLAAYAFSLRAYVNATIMLKTKMKVKDKWTDMRYVRDQNITFGLEYQGEDGLELGLGGRFLGKRWEDNWFTYYPKLRPNVTQSVTRHPSAMIFNASAHYNLTKQLRLGVNFDNLLDEHYTEKDGYHMMGRSFMIKASYRF